MKAPGKPSTTNYSIAPTTTSPPFFFNGKSVLPPPCRPPAHFDRKEKTLLAHKTDPNPVFPYAVCYDGIVHTRAHTSPSKSRLEFSVIEVKPAFDPTKWQEDLTKLYAGCRAILAALKRNVQGHEPTMRKVVAAGVLQAGRLSLFFSEIIPNSQV